MNTPSLPNEVFLHIFSYARPIMTINSSTYAKTTIDWHSAEAIYPRFTAYYSDLTHLAQLRSVSRDWNFMLVKLIYEHIYLPSAPLEAVRRVVGILHHHSDFVRSVTICDLGDYGSRTTDNRESLSECYKILTRNLKALNCKPSNIRNFEIFGRSPTYQTRNWGANTLPALPTSISKLSMALCGFKSTCIALVELGRTLQELDIVDWNFPIRSRWNYPTFHLPKEMPLLKTLRLTSCNSFRMDYLKLFSRIGVLTYCPKRKQRVHKSRLQEFYLHDLTCYLPTPTTTILSYLRVNEVGKGLTVLHIHQSHSPKGNLEAATAIAKECQALVELHFAGAIQPDFFPSLGSDVKRLAVAIWPCHDPMLETSEDSWWASLIVGYFNQDRLLDAVVDVRYQLERLTVLVQCLPRTPKPDIVYEPGTVAIIREMGIVMTTEYLDSPR